MHYRHLVPQELTLHLSQHFAHPSHERHHLFHIASRLHLARLKTEFYFIRLIEVTPEPRFADCDPQRIGIVIRGIPARISAADTGSTG